MLRRPSPLGGSKAKVSAQRKQRGWKGTNAAKGTSSQDKKQMSTCASCRGKGHWKGHPECPNVKSGKDPLHSATSSTSTTRRAPNGGVGTMTVHEVNYTFMVGNGGEVDERPTPSPKCPDCGYAIQIDAKFCGGCGKKRSKRGWLVVGEKESHVECESDGLPLQVFIPLHVR